MRLDLHSGLTDVFFENCPPAFFLDPSFTFISLYYTNEGSIIYNCKDSSVYGEYEYINSMIYSRKHHKMFLFSTADTVENTKIRIVDNALIDTTFLMSLETNKWDEAFFSANEDYLYFTSLDSIDENKYNETNIICLDIINNSIKYKKKLKNFGRPNASAYSIKYGRMGKAIIHSTFYKDTLVKYINIYDFDKDLATGPYTYSNITKDFLLEQNNFLAQAEQYNDSSNGIPGIFKCSGKVDISRVLTNGFLLYKTYYLPADGEFLNFPDYPDYLYYIYGDYPKLSYIKISITESDTLSSLSPSIAVTGSGGFPLHVTGKGFTTNSKVLWNSSPRSTTYHGDTLLSASITAADISIAGKYAVTVTSGDSLNMVSDSLVFLVTDQLPKPIRLLEEKMTDNHDGTFMVCFGYDNANDGALYISGSTNAFTPGNPDRGQPVLFLPGRHKYAFCANFKSGEEATWRLLDHWAKVKTICDEKKKIKKDEK
jgi:hypothetical protein